MPSFPPSRPKRPYKPAENGRTRRCAAIMCIRFPNWERRAVIGRDEGRPSEENSTVAHSLNILEITPDLAGATLAALLRKRFPERSWTSVRQLVAARRVRVNADVCLDPARRLKAGDMIEVFDQPLPKLPEHADIVIRHLDRHVV